MKTSQTDHRDTFGNARITKKAPIRVGTSHSDRAQGFHKQPVPRSEPLPSTMEIKAKLLEGFWIEEVKVIAMGKSFFHLIFNNLDDQCKILSEGSFFLKPGFMCFTRWVPGFNFLK